MNDFDCLLLPTTQTISLPRIGFGVTERKRAAEAGINCNLYTARVYLTSVLLLDVNSNPIS